MALQGSGSISLSQISNEFGLPPSKNLGAYRVRETYGALSNISLDTGVPQSGPIKFSDFYNKKLNIIVDCYSATATTPPTSFHFDSMDSRSRASIPLYTFKTDPFSYPENAPITSSDFVSRYGVTPFNLADSGVINNPNPEGNYTWTYSSVSFPEDGSYRIKAVVDDTATIAIGSLLINAGFAGSAVDTTVFIRAGTYNIAVSYNQSPSGSIAAGNFSYFALTIDRILPSSTPASSLEKVGIKNRFVNNFVYMVGGFRGKPSSTSGHKVIAHVNTLIYNSTKGNIISVALRSGYWDSDTELIIDIGPNGRVIGSGGDGGQGGSPGSSSSRGQNGTSAIAILHPCTVRNRGYIQRGHGGGGGGDAAVFNYLEAYDVTVGGGKKGGSRVETRTREVPSGSTGGGGGGGAGYPIGYGGNAGYGSYGYGSSGSRGQDATQATSSPFTVGGTVSGGVGGAGGDRAGSGGNGGPPSRSGGSPGSPPGDNGYAFVIWNDGTGVTITNIDGGTISSGDFPYLYNTVGEVL